MYQLSVLFDSVNIVDDVGKCENIRKFPKGFLFGAATSAYQIEGAWNVSDKGESIWDRMFHKYPELMNNDENGDVACDSYHKYKEDVQLLKFLGVDFYRFSISWPRLLPSGYSNIVSKDGKRYYNDLIDELLANNIKPVITLYQRDLPQSLQELGGWANPLMAIYFEDYARVAFEIFGDRVKTWLTFNEPQVNCESYGSNNFLSHTKMSGIADYMCIQTTLLAHAKVYHLYDKTFRNKQKGRIGMSLEIVGSIPASNTTEDIAFDEYAKQVIIGLYANAIYSKEGGYPKIVEERISRISEMQGFTKSRLPILTREEIDYVKGTYDFLGVNHYTTCIFKRKQNPPSKTPNSFDDAGLFDFYTYPEFKSLWFGHCKFKAIPWGFRLVLNWLRNTYGNPEIIVFGNGYPDTEDTIDDQERISYYKRYLSALLDAIDDGVHVTGYSVWSLMDSLEWNLGYSRRFGLFHVDFTSPNRTRTPKKSAYYYKSIIENRTIKKEDYFVNLNNIEY